MRFGIQMITFSGALALATASCAAPAPSSNAPVADLTPATEAATVEPPAPQQAERVIHVYDVRDLVAGAGGHGGASDLATELHAVATFLFDGEDADISIASEGTRIVAVAKPRVQRWVAATLRERREPTQRDGE